MLPLLGYTILNFVMERCFCPSRRHSGMYGMYTVPRRWHHFFVMSLLLLGWPHHQFQEASAAAGCGVAAFDVANGLISRHRSLGTYKVTWDAKQSVHRSPKCDRKLGARSTGTTALGMAVSNPRWNLNPPGKSPFGFGLNAEVWNGRVAQISFVWVFLQEWIQGKPMLRGIADRDAPNVIAVMLFILSMMGLLGRFAIERYDQNDSDDMMTTASDLLRMDDDELRPVRPRLGPADAKSLERAISLRELFHPNKIADSIEWNLNDGSPPFGFTRNAEIWNGRLAQVSLVWIMAQEFVQGKGMLRGILEGDPNNIAALVLFAALLTALGGLLSSQEATMDFVDRVVDRNTIVPPADQNTIGLPADRSQASDAAAESATEARGWGLPTDTVLSVMARLAGEREEHMVPEPPIRESIRESRTIPFPPPPLVPSYQSFADSLRAMTGEGGGALPVRMTVPTSVPLQPPSSPLSAQQPPPLVKEYTQPEVPNPKPANSDSDLVTTLALAAQKAAQKPNIIPPPSLGEFNLKPDTLQKVKEPRLVRPVATSSNESSAPNNGLSLYEAYRQSLLASHGSSSSNNEAGGVSYDYFSKACSAASSASQRMPAPPASSSSYLSSLGRSTASRGVRASAASRKSYMPGGQGATLSITALANPLAMMQSGPASTRGSYLESLSGASLPSQFRIRTTTDPPASEKPRWQD